ncbi:hypothetical protein HMI51_04505 [Corallococcus coralloides]|nr:hypothetical protein [Corallococcus coralloides]
MDAALSAYLWADVQPLQERTIGGQEGLNPAVSGLAYCLSSQEHWLPVVVGA